MFGNLRIQEPVTTFTDFILGMYCLYVTYKLGTHQNTTPPFKFLRIHILLLGFAVIIGGILGHGFQYHFAPTWKIPGWYIGMISVMFLERSSIEYIKQSVSHRLHKALLIINLVELLVIMVIVSVSLNFFWVEFHSVYGLLLVVFPCHLYNYTKTKDPASKIMLYGIAVLVTAIFVFNYPIILSKWFTNYDFAHVLMLLSIIFFYRAGIRFQTN
ncbi:MAG: hypothetical protein P8P48_02295 [Saprospiraceae bacterium]|nr:hypothetical protein [Saprospiraceae bacterium]